MQSRRLLLTTPLDDEASSTHTEAPPYVPGPDDMYDSAKPSRPSSGNVSAALPLPTAAAPAALRGSDDVTYMYPVSDPPDSRRPSEALLRQSSVDVALDVAYGLESAHSPPVLAQLANPLNACVLVGAIARLWECVHAIVVASVTLAGAPYDKDCVRNTARADPQAKPLMGSALPQVVCDASATVGQFFDVVALGTMACFFVIVLFPDAFRRFTKNFAWLSWACLIISASLAGVLDVVMWVSLKPLGSGSRFSATLSWCWIPAMGTHDDHDSAISLDVLRFACSYMFTPIFIVLGIVALKKHTGVFTTGRRLRERNAGVHVDVSSEVGALRRRIAPQIIWYIFFFGVLASVRLTALHSATKYLDVAGALVYCLSGAVLVLLWAYGEGLLPVLLLGRFARAANPRVTMLPFSLLIMETYGLTPQGDNGNPGSVQVSPVLSQTILQHRRPSEYFAPTC
jgi:hypothetical protein